MEQNTYIRTPRDPAERVFQLPREVVDLVEYRTERPAYFVTTHGVHDRYRTVGPEAVPILQQYERVHSAKAEVLRVACSRDVEVVDVLQNLVVVHVAHLHCSLVDQGKGCIGRKPQYFPRHLIRACR